MKRLRMTFGTQTGISGLIPAFVLKTTEISVNNKASQVITPTVNNSLVMALARMNSKKPQN